MRNENITRKLLSSIAASMLLVMLIFISVVQATHHHRYSETSTDSFTTEYVDVNNECSVCEYLLQTQNGFSIHLVHDYAIKAISASSTIATTYLSAIFSSSRQIHINKGPPAVK